MADGDFNTIVRFDDGATLRDIREKSLNPLITHTKNVLTPKVEANETAIRAAFKEVTTDNTNKFLKFKNSANVTTTIDLKPMIPPEFTGMSISGKNGSATDVNALTFDSAIVNKAGKTATVDFDWDTIVPTHQEKVNVKVGSGSETSINKITFAGNTGKVDVTGKTVTLTVPDDPVEFKAKVGSSGAETSITKIVLEGNTTGSIVDNGSLKIRIPDPGSGGEPSTVGGNFQGFFENLGDLNSNVSSPVPGKSFAFVKDQLLGGLYYTPYMYLNSGWTEVPDDPAITYESISGQPSEVKTIKPDARIKIDSKGQLDLSGLDEDDHFVGFFDSSAELEAACPTPVLDKSFGYFKTATGSYALRAYKRTNGSNHVAWISLAPYGVLSAFTKSGGDYTPNESFHGIEKNSMVTINSGVVTIKEIAQSGGSIEVQATDKTSGSETTKEVTKLHFKDGVYVDTTSETGTAIIEHPQRLIEYSPTWEEAHKDGKYLGNIFYDRTSGTWMGYSVGTDSGDTTPKWTRIAHREMSNEVKGLNLRHPINAPVVVPGQLGDNRQWEHTGWSYVDSAFDVGLMPESEFKNKGVYIQTYSRKGPNDGPTDRPSKRIQMGIIDEESGEIFTRIQNDAAGPTDQFWKGWTKVSMSQKDIDAHNEDPHAHRTSHKYYRVYSIDMDYSILKSKQYNLYDKDMLLMADSHGIALKGSQQMVIPYDGNYNMSGKFTIDQFFNTATGIPQKQWKFEIRRTPKGGGTTKNYQFVYNQPKVTGSTDDVTMEWALKDQEFKSGDLITFYLQCMDDGDVATNYPNAKLVPVRSYIVIEDSDTVCGSRIAESFRQTFGVIKQRGDTGISLHRKDYNTSSATQRLYASSIIKTFGTMEKVS